MHQDKSPKIDPCLYDQFIFDKDANIIQLEKMVFSTNIAGLTGYLYEKKLTFDYFPTYINVT